jgi:hypothetical protein
MNMRTEDGKALFRDHHIVYVYHNRIDAIGDKLQTEDKLPEAAEDAIDDLTKLVRKLTSANFSNILVLSRIRAAPSARLGHLAFECQGAFSSQC